MLNDENTQLILNTINTSINGLRDEFNQNFDKMDERFNAINSRLDKMDERFNGIDSRLDKMDERFNGIDSRLDKMDERFDGIDTRFDNNDDKVESIQLQLTALINTVTRMEVIEGERLQIALEHASIAIEQHESIMKSLDEINSKIDNHELRSQILEEKVL